MRLVPPTRERRGAGYRALCCALLAVLASVGWLDAAEQAKPTEYQVKAAYLYNFGRFVKWSQPSNQSPLSSFPICVLGDDHFGPVLDNTVAGERIDNLPITVRRLSSPADATGCRIVFVDRSEEHRLANVLPLLSHSGVLTVSDMPGFTDKGGMIQFRLAGDRVRFDVNLAAAERAGLTLSSDLLKVATNVRRGGE
jgi:hypothetical protein